MGISGTQFWATSKNGKAMMVFLASNGHIELVRDISEWLIVERRKALVEAAVQKGANVEQANIVAVDGVAELESLARGINDRTANAYGTKIVDTVFHDHHVKGTWNNAMVWLADALRKRVKDI